MRDLEIEQKVKVLSQLGFGIRKVSRLGNSYAIIVPKEWVEYFCLRTDDAYWVQMSIDEDNTLRISPLTEADLKAIRVRKKADDRC